MSVELAMQVSVSRLKSFAACPFRAAWKYVEGNTEPESEPTVFGKAVHEILRQVGAFYDANRKMPATKQLTAWINEQKEAATQTGLLSASAVKDISQVAKRGLDRIEAIPTDARILVEHHFNVPVPGHEGVALQGFIDLAYITADGTEAVISDWKTNRKGYEVGEDPAHQLPLYAWALLQEFPSLERIRLRLNFLRLDLASEAVYEADLGESAVEYLLTQVDRILARYESGEFPATPGSVCGTCPAALTCPAANAPASAETWGRDDAEVLLGYMLASEAKQELLKAAVRRYVEQNGAIQCGGEYAGLYSKPALSFTDKATIMVKLAEMGVDPVQFLKLDETALRRQAEDNAEIEALGVWRAGSPRFEHKPTPPDEIEGEVEVAAEAA